MKGDDMDEILRKAAENYEVDADAAADWDSVYAAVHETDEKTVVTNEKKKRRFAFWWLFLIPLGWVAHTEYNKYYPGINTKPTNNNSVSSTKTKPAVDETKSQQPSTVNNNSSSKKEIAEQPAIANSSTPTHTKNLVTSNHKHQLVNTNPNSIANNTTNNSFATNNITNNSLPPQKSQAKQILPQIQNAHPKESANNQQQKSNELVTESTTINNQQNNLSTATNSSAEKQNQNAKLNNVANTKTKALSNKKEKLNTNYFYTGLMIGGDLSSVKYQEIKPFGYNAGLLLGYKFNKLSIESGFFVDKKNYYTKGEYFDKSKIPFFNNAEILTADGYCKMFEIPLNVKYDFSVHKNHTWFATAGFSSYLMNKEYYNYAYTKNGQEYNGSASYYKTTKDWFSVLNVSAGYQLQTGNKINLRIEPYYKIPLSGMGTANLHITSIGVEVGITRRIP